MSVMKSAGCMGGCGPSWLDGPTVPLTDRLTDRVTVQLYASITTLPALSLPPFVCHVFVAAGLSGALSFA